MDRLQLETGMKALKLDVNEKVLDQFEQFEDALYRFNEVKNVTRIPRSDCVIKHFLDSLLIAEFIPEGSLVLDIGAGPGFPAWPLAVGRPDLKLTALDSNRKMLQFLETQLLLNLRCELGRAEEIDKKEAFDFVTGRAIAPLAVQLEISAQLCKVGGVIVPMRTPSDSFEKERIKVLGLEQESVAERVIPFSSIKRCFPFYRKKQKTPASFPRSWAAIKKDPLF